MHKTVLALVLVLLSTALYAAEPVTGGLRAPEAQASPDQQKTPAARMPGVSGFVGQGSSGKPAWEWSDEERIRVRFDPASIRERAAAHEASLPPYARAQVQSAQAPQSSQHIKAQSAEAPRSSQRIVDGSRDPGLFLPAELLDVLLEGLHTNASFRAHARDALAKDIRGMGYTENDFWNKLEQLSAPYRALTLQPKNLTVKHVKTSDGKMASFLIDVDRCVARDNLLQSARTTLGAQAFQRFLYTAVAPQFWSGEGESTQGPDRAQELIFVAGGCGSETLDLPGPRPPRSFTQPQLFRCLMFTFVTASNRHSSEIASDVTNSVKPEQRNKIHHRHDNLNDAAPGCLAHLHSFQPLWITA